MDILKLISIASTDKLYIKFNIKKSNNNGIYNNKYQTDCSYSLNALKYILYCQNKK